MYSGFLLISVTFVATDVPLKGNDAFVIIFHLT